MKKSLFALACLGAFSGVSSAQSNVTLYGLIDQCVVFQDPAKNGVSSTGGKLGKSTVKLVDGCVAPSRFGVKGTEDLGDGLRAYFVLEASVSADTGAAGGTTSTGTSSFFDRESYIALGSKSLGDVRFGRLETLSRETAVNINDASFDGELSIFNTVGSNTDQRPLFQNFGRRTSNGITYRSPVLAGFQGIVTVGLSERFRVDDGLGTLSKAAQYRGAGVIYGGGKFSSDLIYEEYAKGAVSGSYNKAVTVGGNYDFGLLVLVAAYQHTSDVGPQLAAASSSLTPFEKGDDVNAFNVGIRVPFGQWVYKLQYTYSKLDRSDGLGDQDQFRLGTSIAYILSKRTAVYAGLIHRGGDDHSEFIAKTVAAAGVLHSF